MFWFNDPVGPDETVLVTGADLNQVTSASIARIDDQASTSKAQQETPVEILQANPLVAEICDSKGIRSRESIASPSLTRRGR